MAASIPVLLFGGWTAYRSAEEHRAAALRTAQETVSQVAERVTAEMASQERVAETLAASTALDGPDLPTFYEEARRVAAMHPLWLTVELDDRAGEQVLNLLRPLGASLGPTADRDTFDEVLRDRAPVIGGIGPVGPVSGKRLVALRVPVTRGGALRNVLTVALRPDAVGDILRDAGIPPGWIGAVVDRDGRLVARSRDEATTVGLPASPDVRRAIATGSSGFYKATTRDGVPVETVFGRLAACGAWSVHLGVPRDALDSPVRRAILAVAVAGAVSLALVATLVTLLARDLGRRRQRERGLAAAELEESEGRTALAVAGADLGTWRWNVAGDAVSCSERCRVLVGLPGGADHKGAWPPAAFLAAIHPADRGAVRAAAKDCVGRGGAFAADFRMRGDGTAAPWRHLRGRAGGGERRGEVYGIIADIDAQKRAEAERFDLLRRLANAQEDVQRRIAHDLHDQIGQTVTGLSLGLKGLERMLEGSPRDKGSTPFALGERVRWLRDLSGAIGRDIHRVASDLRPTALDDLGLPKALAALAADWSARYGVAVDVQVIGSEERLPDELATAIYRVVQEALTNVLKHARARMVSVVLDRRPNDVRLVIEDDGAGFDPDMAPAPGERRRIGLLGMRERLSLIGGTLRVEASPGAGTSLFVNVPLDPEDAGEETP